MRWWDWMPWSSLIECWVFSQLFHSPLSLLSTGFLVPLCISHCGPLIWAVSPGGLKKENTHHLVVIRLQPLSTLSLEELRVCKQDTDPQRAEMHKQSDDFRESRVFHLPIYRKALNSLTWVIWFSLIDNNVLMFRLPAICCKTSLTYGSTPPSPPPWLSFRVTWDAVSQAWSPQNSHCIK